MSGQPLEQAESDWEFLSEQILSLKTSDINSFRAKRVHQIAKEFFNKYPDNVKIVVLYIQSFFAVNKRDEIIKAYETLVLPHADKKFIMRYLNIYTKYASVLYMVKDYKKALQVTEEIELIPESQAYHYFLGVSLPIYFENEKFDNIARNINQLAKISGSYSGMEAVYLLFYYYSSGKSKLLVQELNNIAIQMYSQPVNTANLDNIIETFRQLLQINVAKPTITTLEEEYLANIRKIGEMICNQGVDNLLTKKIEFEGKIYTLNIEIYPDNWFYGELQEIENCRSQARSLVDLENSIKQYVELILETGQSFFVPTKELLQEMRNEDTDTLEASEKESREWLNAELDENFNKPDDSDGIPAGRPVRFVEGHGLVYIDE